MRYPEVRVADSGNILIGVDGIHYTPNIQAILTRINEIRMEAYRLGYVSRYEPAVWSNSLQEAAKTRAAEAMITVDHKRLTNKSVFTAGTGINAENLAWNNTNNEASFIDAIEQFYSEKSEYLKERAGQPHGETGHYKSMINPDLKYVGFGSFDITPNKWTTISMLMSRTQGGTSSATAFGNVTQYLEALGSDVSNIVIGDSSKITETTALKITGVLNSSKKDAAWVDAFSSYVYPTLPVTVVPSNYSVEDESIATVNSEGVITPLKSGTTNLVVIINGKTYKKSITVDLIPQISNSMFIEIDKAGKVGEKDGKAIFHLGMKANEGYHNLVYKVYSDVEKTTEVISNTKVEWEITPVAGFEGIAAVETAAKQTLEHRTASTYVAGQTNTNKASAVKSGVYKVTAKLPNGESDYAYLVVPGDVNRNGSIDVGDVSQFSIYYRTSDIS